MVYIKRIRDLREDHEFYKERAGNSRNYYEHVQKISDSWGYAFIALAQHGGGKRLGSLLYHRSHKDGGKERQESAYDEYFHRA